MSGRGSPPAVRARAWWASRTLRTRLVAGLLALLVLTCAVVGVSTTLALRGFLVGRLDTQLVQSVGPVTAVLERPGAGGGRLPLLGPPGSGPGDDGDGPGGRAGRGPDEGGFAGQRSGALGVRLVDGEVAAAVLVDDGPDGPALVTPDLGDADVAALTALARSPRPGRPDTVELEGLGRFRATATAGRGATTVIALPTAGIDATTARLVTIELVVFALAVALAGLAGALLVRLSLRPLRPLRRVAATATAVAATPMGSGAVTMPTPIAAADTDERTEVGQVGAAFTAMLDRVGASLAQRQATEERLRQFVADASHELRTPLAAIRGHSELAGRQSATLPPDVAHALSRVNSESLRMGVLVDDLLLLARLDAGRPLAREEVDLTRLVLDVTSDAGAAERGRPGHRWRLDLPEEPVLVVGDGHRLHQVLANLLANARVHTPPGTEVTVRLSEAEPGRTAAPGSGDLPHAVELSVSDDGPGVPPEVAERVFERFVRADVSRTRSGGADDGPGGTSGAGSAAAATGSSGLGLAIVDAVVTAHGGTVGLESRPGHTCFRVRLPGRPGVPAPQEPTAAVAG